MAAYNVSYTLRNETESLTGADREEYQPNIRRVAASDAQRAISKLVNEMKTDGEIQTKSDVKILEAKVVA